MWLQVINKVKVTYQGEGCNIIGQMLDFAWSTYSYNFELVRYLAFRIKHNFAFRLFIDN